MRQSVRRPACHPDFPRQGVPPRSKMSLSSRRLLHGAAALLDAPAFRCDLFAGLARDSNIPAASNLFAAVAQTPAAQDLLRRVEGGGALSCSGVSPAGRPFL